MVSNKMKKVLTTIEKNSGKADVKLPKATVSALLRSGLAKWLLIDVMVHHIATCYGVDRYAAKLATRRVWENENLIDGSIVTAGRWRKIENMCAEHVGWLNDVGKTSE